MQMGTYHIHYSDVIMSTMSSRIASLTIVYSGADQRKHQKFRVTGLCGEFKSDIEFPAQRACNAEMFPFDGSIMQNLIHVKMEAMRFRDDNEMLLEISQVPLANEFIAIYIDITWVWWHINHNKLRCLFNSLVRLTTMKTTLPRCKVSHQSKHQ